MKLLLLFTLVVASNLGHAQSIQSVEDIQPDNSNTPMKVISNQSPAFYGDDRVFKH